MEFRKLLSKIWSETSLVECSSSEGQKHVHQKHIQINSSNLVTRTKVPDDEKLLPMKVQISMPTGIAACSLGTEGRIMKASSEESS